MSAGISDKECPFQGLQPFFEQDAEYFAGRDNEAQVVISALYSTKLTVYYGESGVGKTSVISAAVLPELNKAEHRVAAILFRDWQLPTFPVDLRKAILQSLLRIINRLRGDREPLSFETLETAFCAALRKSATAAPLTTDALYNEISLERFMMECCAAFAGRLFFIFDQFEEYFYYHPLGSPGAEFDGAFACAVNSPDVPATFLVSLREDGLGKLDRLRGRIPHLFGNMLRLEHLDRHGIEEAIRKPISAYNLKTGRNVSISDELVDALISQVREDRIGFTDEDRLPSWQVKTGHESQRFKGVFLQVVLTRLWKTAIWDGNKTNLTLDSFLAAGQGHEVGESEAMFIVRTYFNDMMSRLPPPKRDIAAEILRFLVRPGGQKKSRTAAELTADAGLNTETLDTVTKILEQLASDREEFRLLTRIEGSTADEYEIRHDVMGLALRDWCDRHRERLREARQRASEEQQRRELLAKEKNRRRVWAILAAASIVIALIVAREARLTADRNALQRKHLVMARAQSLEDDARKVISQSKTMKIDPYPAMLATIDGITGCLKEGTYAPEGALIAMRAAVDGVSSEQKPSAFDPRDNRRPATGKMPEFIPVFSSPDGNVLITVENNDTPVLWDTWTFEAKRLASVGAAIFAVGFSLDSKRVAVASSRDSNPARRNLESAVVFVWEIPKGVKKVSPQWSTSGVNLVKTIAPASDDNVDQSNKIPPDVMRKLVKTSEVGAWADYEELTTRWVAEAVGLIVRRYSKDERMSFQKLPLGTDEVIFTDEANAAREQAMSDVEGAKAKFSETLRKFGLGTLDAGTVLAQMYVSSAQQKSLQPAYRAAAADYDRAQQLNPRLDLSKSAEALRKLQDGNELAPTDPRKVETYRLAQSLDKSLIDSLVPDLLVQSSQLAEESKVSAEMNKLLNSANEAAKAGESQKAKDLYQQAKALAPMTLNRLNPDEEIQKLSPKGPAKDDSRPNPALATPTPPTG